MFLSILRKPDSVFGATEESPFRFEEEGSCDVKYEYVVEENSAKVVVYPSGAPVKYLKLRWQGELDNVDKVYGDQWERAGINGASLDWRSVIPHRILPWFCYLLAGDNMACYGVKTGPDCFAFWQVDTHGVTLFLNLTSGDGGVDLKEPLTACETVELFAESEDSYRVACRFAKKMCDKPILPAEPIFGVNNWYWAYGRISKESVMTETDYLMEMCDGTNHRPYMILDDGWQINRTYGSNIYIGGPWIPNERFGNMAETAEKIRLKGAKTGLWFRPLLTLGEVPDEAKFSDFKQGGIIMDPSHPYTLERVEKDAARIRDWGFDLIKHDFTTTDITGDSPLIVGPNIVKRPVYDKTRTNATIIKDLYKAIQRGAGGADVIGCNTVSHLTAGIHSVYRTGNDTSGRSFEWTRRNGVNSVMRLPLNDSFYRADPDCAAFTERVDPELNLDFLEMCAITGMTTLASVAPGILTSAQMKRINEIFKMADSDTLRYQIKNYDKNANPDIFTDGKSERRYRWDSAYNGARTVLSWKN